MEQETINNAAKEFAIWYYAQAQPLDANIIYEHFERYLKPEWQKQQSPLRWVKASEFNYTPLKTYYAKWPSGTVIKSTGHFLPSGIFFWNNPAYIPVLKKELEQLLILDESPIPQSEGGIVV